MNKRAFFLLAPALVLAGCGMTSSSPDVGTDGRPLPRVYKISPAEQNAIPFRLLDSVNTLRAAKSLSPLAYDAQLNAAARNGSR